MANPGGSGHQASRVGWKARRHDKGLNGEEKRGGEETDQYGSGNKVEKVIYLTLIRCHGGGAAPASLLLTFKPECTHKRWGSQLTGVNYGSKEVAVPLSLPTGAVVTALKKFKHQ